MRENIIKSNYSMSPLRKTLSLLMIFSCIVVQECKRPEIKGYGQGGPPAPCTKVDCPTYTIIHTEK